jgi:RNA polymerase sigma-70 factor (ECF subfamily)
MKDSEIIRGLEQREESALRGITASYGSLGRQIAMRILGSAEDTEECLNDAMLTAWNAIPPAKPKNFRAYLLRLVRNAALDRYRAARTEKRSAQQTAGSLDELAEIIPDGSDVVSETERRETLAAVTEFLLSLPQKQRDLFVQRYWYAAEYDVLSQTFRMSEAHVRVTLSRLRKRLQKYLEKEGLL